MSKPTDPVLLFIISPEVRKLVTLHSDTWPWSRLSASRLEKIGYRLICLRCAQLAIDAPTRQEAAEWAR